MQNVALIQKQIIDWNQKYTTTLIDHPLLKKEEASFTERIRKDLLEIFAYAHHLTTGVTELALLKQDKDQRITQFVELAGILSKELDLVNFDIFRIYTKVRDFFTSYYRILAVMAICSFSWFVYSFSMLIPTKHDEPALFSKPCGITFLVLGACVFSLLGSILFLRSQLLINDCVRAVKLLDHPDTVHRLYSKTSAEWANICLSEYSTGNMSLFFRKPEHIQEFNKPLSILKAFSSSLTNFDFSGKIYEPESLRDYSAKVEAYSDYALPDGTS